MIPVYDPTALPPDYARLADVAIDPEAAQATGIMDPDPDSISPWLAELREDLVLRIPRLARAVRVLGAEADVLEGEAERLHDLASARRRRADHLKGYMQREMEAAGAERFKELDITVWLQQSPGSVEVVDEALVPDEYKVAGISCPVEKVTPELAEYVRAVTVSKMAINEALERDGVVPDGVRIVTDRRHLRIR